MTDLAPFSRRQFLSLVSLGAAALLPLPVLAQDDVPARTVNIPPSLMLHSRESREHFMGDVMAGIAQRGWEAITYLDYLQRAQTGLSVENTVLISIDDISCAAGNLSFEYFQRMYGWVRDGGGVATFGVITEPDKPQDEARWDILAGWVAEGFELATHTSNHLPFNAAEGGQRPDFSQADFTYEIADSARMIEQKMAERGLDYQVRTLITPFGSGWDRESASVYEGVRAACLEAGISFVVGIVDGRDPLPTATLSEPDALAYVGRTPPGYPTNAEGVRTLDAPLTLAYLEGWIKQWHA